MAISKAARWISFAVPQTPSAQPTVQQAALAPVLGSDEKQFGFTNFGNTCYANSVLQALYFCSPFRDLVLQSIDASTASSLQEPPAATLAAPPMLRRQSAKRAPSEPAASAAPDDAASAIPAHPPTLFSALRSLFMYISKHPAEKGVVAPRAFVDKLKAANELFQGTQHQDAHEFLNYLLNKIVEEIQTDRNHRDGPLDGFAEDLSSSVGTLSSGRAQTSSSSSSTEPTLVQRLFEGTLTSETRCLTCETVTSRDESFLDLSIDIEQNSSVTACLRQFSASEMLCQKNKFFCDGCAGLQEAEKRMKIKKLPNILALHLKRFKYQEDIQKYIKLTYRVAFPFELRLFNTVDDAPDPDRLYELFGIVIHIGAGPHHGHYITIIKGPHSWLVYDDDKIEAIKEADIAKYFGDSPGGAAYVLFYEAVNLAPSELGLHTASPMAGATDVPAPLPVVSLEETAAGVVPVAAPPGLQPTTPLDEHPASTSPLPDGRSGTSASTSAPASPVLGPQGSVPSVPSLRVRTSSSHLQPNGHPPSPLKSPKSTPGSLRRLKLRGAGDAPPTSPHEPTPRRPSTAPGSTAADEAVPPVPPLPTLQVNGGAQSASAEPKSPERKRSRWFRRSVRATDAGASPGAARREEAHETRTVGTVGTTSSVGSVAQSVASAGAPSQSSTATAPPGGEASSSVFRRSSLRLGNRHSRRVSAGTFELPPTPRADAHPTAHSEEARSRMTPLTPVPGTPGVGNGHMAPPLDMSDKTSPAPAPDPEPEPTPTTPTRAPARVPSAPPVRGPPPVTPPRSPARPKTASAADATVKGRPGDTPATLKARDSEPAHGHGHHHLLDKLRPHSAHGHRPPPPTALSGAPPLPVGVDDSTTTTSEFGRDLGKEKEKEKEAGGGKTLKRAVRKLSITGAMFGLGGGGKSERRASVRPVSAYVAPGTPR